LTAVERKQAYAEAGLRPGVPFDLVHANYGLTAPDLTELARRRRSLGQGHRIAHSCTEPAPSKPRGGCDATMIRTSRMETMAGLPEGSGDD
jgi:hypothetical protein